MFDALMKADVKALDVDSFLFTLLAEHYAVGARAQLKSLGIQHARALLEEEEEAQVQSGAEGGGGGVFAPGPRPA